jgi:hypothetical protein
MLCSQTVRTHADVKLLLLAFCAALLPACSHGGTFASADAAVTVPIKRPGFLGAFFRPQGVPPYGVFSVYSKQMAPDPYPPETPHLFGPTGYCDRIVASGNSISTGFLVDSKRIANIKDLGVSWARVPVSTFFTDLSHINSPGPDAYAFGQLDSAECALVRNHIEPIVGLEAGPVQYNPDPQVYAPKTIPIYKTAADFGNWCAVIAKHESRTFSSVTRFSLPGNEVNSNGFPDGEAQIAAYSEACYHAIKAILPKSQIYGFELNADRNAEPAAFVQRMYDLGCKVGTCYDAISFHISLRYPIPARSTPCYPNSGGDYGMQCLQDVRLAAHAPKLHLLIGETGYFVPGNVPDEETKAQAIVDEYHVFAQDPLIDGVNYANIDECDLYPSGYFVGGCLVDSLGKRLPGFTALQQRVTNGY